MLTDSQAHRCVLALKVKRSVSFSLNEAFIASYSSQTYSMALTTFVTSLPSAHLGEVCGQSHLAALAERAQQAGVADEEVDGAAGDGLRVVVDEVQALEMAQVVAHATRHKALQLLHVEGTGHVWAACRG